MNQIFAIIKTGGKQYLVKEGDEIVVDKLKQDKDEKVFLDTMLIFDRDGKEVKIGNPILKEKTTAQIIEHLKGEKVRILRFKAKVRYRKRKGFRADLTKLKILKIEN